MLSNQSVVGIDPSLTATGYADKRGAATIRTLAKGEGVTDLGRMQTICSQVMRRVREVEPLLVVIEGLAFASRTGKPSERAGLHWMLRDLMQRDGLPVAVVPPASLKKYACGRGNAQKEFLLQAHEYEHPGVEVANDNECDAVWLMAMGLAWLNEPIDPQFEWRAPLLDGVDWPEPYR